MATSAGLFGYNLQNQEGFTLIEILSVVVILGILTSTTIHRFNLLSDTAGRKSLTAGIRELNIRESLTWAQFKISTTGWPGDDEVYAAVDTALGSRYYWAPPVEKTGGALHFESQSVDLNRTPSTLDSPAIWQ